MAAMTVARLHKMLGQLIEEGQGRRPVVMNKASFYHPLESDGVVILDVTEAKADTITMADDDGWTAARRHARSSCSVGSQDVRVSDPRE